MSPDVTHKVTVIVGDTLPGLCDQIYGDPSLYAQVAKYNSLNKFRTLEPGQLLIFPPITSLTDDPADKSSQPEA